MCDANYCTILREQLPRRNETSTADCGLHSTVILTRSDAIDSSCYGPGG